MKTNIDYVGNIDSFNEGKIIGWASDNSTSNSNSAVDIYINDIHVVTVECFLSRKDVNDAGYLGTNVGFDYDLAPFLQFYSTAIISIKHFNTDIHLSGSPLKIGSFLNESLLISTNTFLKNIHPVPENVFFGVETVNKINKSKLLNDFRQHYENGGIIVVFPPLVDWNIPLFQRPQHMAKWLAKCGVKVLYASVGWKYDNADGFYQFDENLYWTNELPNIIDLMPSSWITVYSTNFNYTINDLNKWKENGHKILYEYIDHIDPKISGNSAKVLTALFNGINTENTDLFLASAHTLKEELLQRFDEEQIAFIQNGVDTDFYFNCKGRNIDTVQNNFRIVAERSANGREIVGYFGAIAPWLDYDLIEALASNNPLLDFVFIGPAYGLEHELPAAENVFWIGQIDYPNLPNHAVWFDVCFIPFEKGQIAKTTSPLKLYEYFALGKPVVVTSAMLECVQYEFVGHGATSDEVSLAILNALEKTKDKKYSKFLKEQAAQHSWKSRSEDLIAAFKKKEINIPQVSSRIDIASIMKSLAFNTKRPERIVGAIIRFNLKRNIVKATLSNQDWIDGDLLSLTLTSDIPSALPIVTSSFRVVFSENGLANDICKVDYLLSDVIIKTIDICDLKTLDIVSITHKAGEKIEIRLRVLKDIPIDWIPNGNCFLTLSNLTQMPCEKMKVPSLICSNPLGIRNPLYNNI